MGSQRAETRVISTIPEQFMPFAGDVVEQTRRSAQNPIWNQLQQQAENLMNSSQFQGSSGNQSAQNLQEQALGSLLSGGNQQATNLQNAALENIMSGQAPTVNTSQNPLYQTGKNYLQDVLSGTYLSPSSNPWLEQAYQAAARPIQQLAEDNAKQLGSQYNAGGMYYSGPAIEAQRRLAENTQQQLADLAANIYGNAYMQERANQQNALNQALNYAQMPAQDIINNAALASQYASDWRQNALLGSAINESIQNALRQNATLGSNIDTQTRQNEWQDALTRSQLGTQSINNVLALLQASQLPIQQQLALLSAFRGTPTQDVYYPSAGQQILGSAIEALPFFFL